jgi:3-oxoacyl-[acyl-carrier-protein] synthase-3
MARSRFSRTAIRGVTTAVPGRSAPVQVQSTALTEDELQKVIKVSGVKARHIAAPTTTTADLTQRAAEALLTDLGWDRSSVDALIFVTQTPDYLLPATACVLQNALGLSKGCAAFDVNLGCSGYTYGLWLASTMIDSGACKRVLLLAGDTISKIVSPADRSTAFLFGDAGSATALERDDTLSTSSYFVLGSDGSGASQLIVPGSGARGACVQDRERKLQSDGNTRGADDLYMNGSEIFNFTIGSVPALAAEVLESASKAPEEVDFAVFHQANEFMIKHLSKKTKIPSERVPLSLGEYGNTSSASIPMTLTSRLPQALLSSSQRLLLLGFGVGYSWAGAYLSTGPLASCRVVECPDL